MGGLELFLLLESVDQDPLECLEGGQGVEIRRPSDSCDSSRSFFNLPGDALTSLSGLKLHPADIGTGPKA